MKFEDFAKMLQENEELREEFKGTENIEDAFEMAVSHGLEATFEEFKEQVEKMTVVTLSDEDLALVSGGGTETVTDIITITAGVIEGTLGAW